MGEIGHSWHRSVMRECSRSHFPNLQTPKGHSVVIPFEMLVLDNALHTVIGKFSRHLGLIRFLLANRFYMGFVKKWRHKHIEGFLDHPLKCGRVFFSKSYELLLHSSTIILQWSFSKKLVHDILFVSIHWTHIFVRIVKNYIVIFCFD